MGRGRAPCCDKSKVKRGPWSPAEDLRLITFIQKHGHGNWRALPRQAGLVRCGKSCRLRWINYLRPDVKRGNFTPEEEEIIIKLHNSLGNKWSKIASHFPGRTDNEIKNVWNTHLKKRLNKQKDAGADHCCNKHEADESSGLIDSSSPSSSSTSLIMSSYGDQNMGKGTDGNNNGDQEGQDSMTKISSASSTSSSICSHASNFSNLSEEIGSLLDFGGPLCEFHNGIPQCDERTTNNEVIEIPLESDFDFWDMLDNCNLEAQRQEFELEASQKSCSYGVVGEELSEAECSKWLRYLENELGLVGTSGDEDQQMSSQKNAADDDDMKSKPEIDMSACLTIWPSSPLNFGI